jgi:hypothetical protein
VRQVAHGRLYEPQGMYEVLSSKASVETAETDRVHMQSHVAIADEMFMYLAGEC